jgi:ABC-type Mn2+/Zn2+ transport system ATPase subunit
MTTPLLAAEALQVGYAGGAILPPVSFAVQPGELWVVAGPNGAGKSTLIRTLAGLIPPLGGRFTPPAPQDLAYLPQRLLIDPQVPIRGIDLIRQGAERRWQFLRPWLSADQRQQIEIAIQQADCADLTRRSYHTLSEGQRQRILLARALASRPALLLMDEPTSAMDPNATLATLHRLDELRCTHGTAILLISHHLDLSLPMADKVLFLDREEGEVLAGPTTMVTAHPAWIRRFPAHTADHLARRKAP